MITDKAQEFLYYFEMLAINFPVPEAEFKFDPVRKWRFDWAWPSKKIAVEVEGNAWHVPGGGRHMQDKDLEKYNTATLDGWRVFRFSPGMLERDPVKCISMIMGVLND